MFDTIGGIFFIMLGFSTLAATIGYCYGKAKAENEFYNQEQENI